MPALTELDKDIAEEYSHARNVSVRDGIQSLLANKVRNKHIIKIVEAENPIPPMVEKYGFEAAPTETGGGGQFLQPANFLKEDPMWTHAQLHKVAPNVKLQWLNRGRQAWGFGPVSAEVLEAGLQAASDRGLKVVRVFDMMNDARNLEATFEAVRKINVERPSSDRLMIEGAVSYNSEPRDSKKRAWTLDEYAAYGVKLAKMGADEIAIKNYAGTGKYEMVELVKTMRHALDEAGFKNKRLNLHMHGHYPQLMADAIDAGAHKVDVAMGELSKGPSFTSVLEFMEERLKRKGYDTSSAEFREAFDNNEIVKQVRKVEQVIHDELAIQHKEAPIPAMKAFTEEQIEKYRMAAGALSDVWTRIAGVSKLVEGPDGKKMRQFNQGKVELKGDEELQLLFERILTRAAELWEVGGRFNTVTPGAKIAADQALALTMIELNGPLEPGKKLPAYKPLESFEMKSFIGQYINIVTGRFGHNQGLEDKGIGDPKLRDSFLMYQAMKTINQAIESGDINNHEQDEIQNKLGKRLPFEKHKGFDLNAGGLQHALKEASIGEFRLAVENLDDTKLRDKLRYELHQDRSPDPTDGLGVGQQIVDKMGGSSSKPIRDAALIKRALKRINDAIGKGEVSLSERNAFTNAADIGKKGARLTIVDEGKNGKPGTFLLDESTPAKKAELDQLLAQSNISNVERAVENFKNEKLKHALHVDLTPIDVKALHDAGAPISHPDIAPVMAMLMRDTTKEPPSDGVYEALVSQTAQNHGPLESVMRARRRAPATVGITP